MLSIVHNRHHESEGCDSVLVLSRKINERIQIGDQIVVTVVRIAEGAVRLGIEAPTEMPIVRTKIYPPSAEQPADRSAPTPR